MTGLSLGFDEPERDRPLFSLPEVSLKPLAITFGILLRNRSEETGQILSCFLFFLALGIQKATSQMLRVYARPARPAVENITRGLFDSTDVPHLGGNC
jgi:hypothetical protein